MKKIFLGFALFSMISAITAQNVLLHKEVKDSATEKFGPNLKNFRHFYLGTGFIVGQSDSKGSAVMPGYSMNFLFGFRYKWCLANWFSMGYEIAYNSNSFRLKQDSAKITPDKTLHNKKEKLSFGDLGAGLYMRFNYGRRGNRIGNFIDIGGYCGWVFSGKNSTKDKMPNGNIVETTITHLNYLNRYNYGALARIGFNRYVIYGSYRLSDIFRSTYNYPELPRLTVGLQIGIHK